MSLFDRPPMQPEDHLQMVFGDCGQEQITRGEKERLRALWRELSALKEAIGEQPLEGVLIRGEALAGVFRLL